MHDPKCVAHEIYLGRKKDKRGNYKSPLITIWHNDPESDGTDDSCGWFIRSRHVNKNILEKVKKEFEFNFKNNYWFNEGGYPHFSVSGLTLEMFSTTSWIIHMELYGGGHFSKKASRKHDAFMRKHLYDILHFAENPTDSLHNSITMKYGVEKPEERISHFVSVITAYIMRKLRPWYKHPRWHIHHWSIQIPIWQRFRRRWFDKCSQCGKRGFIGSAYGDWHGTKIWCEKCNEKLYKPSPVSNSGDGK
jgi:hypothetical protein